MPPDRPLDKLSVVVFSGDYARIHYALVMAGGAAAIGVPVTLFFTMGACRALAVAGADGAPAWRALDAGDGSGPGGAGIADDGLVTRGVAGFEELLTACPTLGVRIMVCEMGLRAMGLDSGGLRPDLPIEPGGVVTFLNDASKDGSLLFV